MNLRRASLFVRVVEAGGFTAAARGLDLPKSALSTAVSQLEAELGVRLLQRTSRQVTLTEAGAQLYERTAPALEALDEAAAAVTELQTELKGQVRLTAPVEVGTRLLEPIVSRFLKEHPGVSVELVLTTRTVDLVEEGFDLALRGGPLKDSGLIARKLGKADAGLFASPAYLEAHGRPTRLADLTAHAFVALQASGRATLKLTGPRGPERVELAPRLSTDHFPFVMRAVLHDVGVGLLPFFLCEDEVTRGALERVLPRYALKATPLHLVYPSARFLPRRVAALRDAIVASLGAELR